MEEKQGNATEDVKNIVRQVLREYADVEREKEEPAYKAELLEERRRRESLERRLNELVEESQRSRAQAEAAEMQAQVLGELQRHGVTKLELAFKALKDDVRRTPDGKLIAHSPEGEVSLKEYVTHFVSENPEFLPARMSGGSGATPAARNAPVAASSVELEKIRPGMSKEEMDRVRQEVARIALQTLSGR